MKDDQTHIIELKEKISKFCKDRDWDKIHTTKDLAIGVVTEASELLDHFRFKSDDEIHAMFKNPTKREDISDEIADITYFVMRIADRYGIDVSEAVENKTKKNAEKYPIEKAKGSNKKYNEF